MGYFCSILVCLNFAGATKIFSIFPWKVGIAWKQLGRCLTPRRPPSLQTGVLHFSVVPGMIYTLQPLMETFSLPRIPRSPGNLAEPSWTNLPRVSSIYHLLLTTFSSSLFFHQEWEKTINKIAPKRDKLELMGPKHVAATLTSYHRRIKSHLVLHLLDPRSVRRPCSCFPELYDSVYKYFICTINIVPLYDVSFGQVLILDHQESYTAWISFGTSIFFTVHLGVSVTSRLYKDGDTICFYWQRRSL